MTKPEAVTQDLVDAITQDICDLDNNPFEGMADDDVWLSVNDLQVILSRHLGEAIQAAIAAHSAFIREAAEQEAVQLAGMETTARYGKRAMTNIFRAMLDQIERTQNDA